MDAKQMIGGLTRQSTYLLTVNLKALLTPLAAIRTLLQQWRAEMRIVALQSCWLSNPNCACCNVILSFYHPTTELGFHISGPAFSVLWVGGCSITAIAGSALQPPVAGCPHECCKRTSFGWCGGFPRRALSSRTGCWAYILAQRSALPCSRTV